MIPPKSICRLAQKQNTYVSAKWQRLHKGNICLTKTSHTCKLIQSDNSFT